MSKEVEHDVYGSIGRRKYLSLASLATGGLAGCSSRFDNQSTSTATPSSTDQEDIRNEETDSMLKKDGDKIRPFSDNPRYWEYSGSPIVLIGGSEDDNLFQWPESELQDQLDLLASLGGNFVRNTMSDRDTVQHSDPDVYAFGQTGSGKYDLGTWNSEYWDRLERFLTETARRDIVVSLELWDEWDHYGDRWDAHPWNPANNVNYTASGTTLETSWDPNPKDTPNPLFRTIPSLNDDSVVLEYQEQYIQKILSITLRYDHILYIITNESHSPKVWSDYWAQIIHEEADAKDEEVYVADMRADGTIQPALDHEWFNFTEVSQHSVVNAENHYDLIVDSWKQLSNDSMPLNSVKQYGCSEEGAASLWRCIFAGQAAARYHRGPDRNCNWGLGLNSKAQAHIESLRLITDKIDVFNAEPHQVVDHLISDRHNNEVYLMANPGRVYALYFPKGGSIKLDVSSVSGNVQVEWLDIEAREWYSTEVLVGPEIRLETPDFNSIIRRLKRVLLPDYGDHWVAVISPHRN